MTSGAHRGGLGSSRRAFLRAAGRAGAAGVALAMLDRGPVRAAALIPGVPEVLHGRIAHETTAAFAGGRRSDLALLGGVDGEGLRALGAQAVYRSPVVPLEFPATHLGARWIAEGAESGGLILSARVSADGQEWSPWLPMEAVGARDTGDGRQLYSALVSVPRGTFLQYRAELPETPGVVLRRVVLSYLNPHDGPPRPLTPRARTLDEQFGFAFRSREQWGADESLRFDAAGEESWPRMYVPAKKLVVHHTATTNDYVDAAAEVRAIYVYHAKELDWGDIGYHALIGRDGIVYEGRRGRGPARDPGLREAISPGVVGGHALFHNYGTAGFALIGTFTDAPLPNLMRQRLIDLLVFEARQHGVDPHGLSDFLRSDGIWHRDVANVSGHRDLVNTECPGDQVYRLLPSIRAAVAERLGGGRAARAGRVVFVSAPPLADTTARTTLAAWAGAGPILPGWRFSYYLERWHRDGPYDILPADNRPVWSPFDAATFARLADLAPGHYTLHVRGLDPLGGQAVYEANTTFHVVDALLADNEDSGQTQRVGTWRRRFEGKGIIGESYEEALAGRGEHVFRWAPLVTEHGRYEVWVHWPDGEGRASNAPYTVVHADGVYSERHDQGSGGGEWMRLGGERLFRFVPGRHGGVALANDADGVVAADAVKLVLRARLGGA